MFGLTITGPDGRTPTAHAHQFVCLWYKPFYTRTVKVILIRNPGTSEGFDVAIACTDTAVAAAQLLSRYDSRWTIERQPRSQGPGRRRGPQPRPESRRADRPVGVPLPDNHDRLVRRSGRPRSRPRPATARVARVSPEGDHQLHRHARRATSRTHPPRVSVTSTPDHHQPETHTAAATVSSGHRLRSRKSSLLGEAE